MACRAAGFALCPGPSRQQQAACRAQSPDAAHLCSPRASPAACWSCTHAECVSQIPGGLTCQWGCQGWLLCVNGDCPGCLLCFSGGCQGCLLPVSWGCQGCWLCINGGCQECLLCVSEVSQGCLLCTGGGCQGCLLCVGGCVTMFICCASNVQHKAVQCPKPVSSITTVARC